MEVFTRRLGEVTQFEVTEDTVVGALCEDPNDTVFLGEVRLERGMYLRETGIEQGDTVDVLPEVKVTLRNMKKHGDLETPYTKLMDVWGVNIVAVGETDLLVFDRVGNIVRSGVFNEVDQVLKIKVVKDFLFMMCMEAFLRYDLTRMDTAETVAKIGPEFIPVSLISSDDVPYQLISINGVDIQAGPLTLDTTRRVTLNTEPCNRITSYSGCPGARMAYSYDEGIKIVFLHSGARCCFIVTPITSCLSLSSDLFAVHRSSLTVITFPELGLPFISDEVVVPGCEGATSIASGDELIVISDRYQATVYG